MEKWSSPRYVLLLYVEHKDGYTKACQVAKEEWSADFVEFTFQDQYLGRNEMWRLGQYLVGQCVFLDQDVSFIGAAVVKVHAIYIGGKKVSESLA